MSRQRVYQAALANLEQDLDGLVGAAFIDLESGSILASHSVEPTFDQSAVGDAGRAAIAVHAELAEGARGEDSSVEEVTVTATGLIHVYYVIEPGVLLSVTAERSEANLAWVKAVVSRCAERMARLESSKDIGPAMSDQRQSVR